MKDAQFTVSCWQGKVCVYNPMACTDSRYIDTFAPDPPKQLFETAQAAAKWAAAQDCDKATVYVYAPRLKEHGWQWCTYNRSQLYRLRGKA
jgi:hypothetical protein